MFFLLKKKKTTEISGYREGEQLKNICLIKLRELLKKQNNNNSFYVCMCVSFASIRYRLSIKKAVKLSQALFDYNFYPAFAKVFLNKRYAYSLRKGQQKAHSLHPPYRYSRTE